MHGAVRILDASIDRVNLNEAVQVIEDFITSGRSHQVVTVNLDFLRIAREDAHFREVINRSELAVADGMPLVWMSRWFGERLPARVTGVELVEQACVLAAREGYRIFLLGGAAGVAEAAGTVLAARYPGLQIAGSYAPPMGPFSVEEDQKMVDLIRAAQPHILFVGFGAPKQDVWIAEHRDMLNVPLAVGVGGVFNFLTGRVRRAPSWMQKSGLEWLYRVMQEPRRLWRRYFLQDFPILLIMAVAALQLHTSSSAHRVADASLPRLAEISTNPPPAGALPLLPWDRSQ